jgi:peptidyl-dipeptidase A
MRRAALAAILLVPALAWAHPETASPPPSPDDAARQFLEVYASMIRGVTAVAGDAQWKAATDVTPEHDGERVAAGKALAAVQGDPMVIQRARALAAAGLDPLLARQLDRVLLNAAESPGTIPEVVSERVEAESRQSSILDSFQFCLERKGDRCVRPITANGIDDLLGSSRSLPERLAVWKASKESGPPLKPGLRTLRDLRNQVAREMGYPSYFDLEVADYGMTGAEMMAMLDRWIADTRPLFEQLHCYAKYTLAERYGKPVPGRIPAHWIDNRWAQSWDGIVPGVDLDPLFRGRTREWVVRQAESFYVSMGFPKLPELFWLKSDLYPVAEGSGRKKNTHASAWHVDLEQDVRSLMSVEPNARWFQTAHHELGHIYYYLAYSRPEVPVLLRGGANRGFHEGIGDLISIASMQTPYLRQAGLLPKDQKVDGIAWLLNEAYRSAIAYLPFAAGTMSHWERDLYAGDLPYDRWNQRWWDYAARFQGIDPPEPRGEDLCDACTKTHVNDDPAQYYDYAVATVLKYQIHDHIARKILGVDPHEANYYGRKDVGDFLRSILEKGQTEDWRTLLRRTTGEDLSTRAMVEYFRPLTEYLEKANAGRTCTLP